MSFKKNIPGTTIDVSAIGLGTVKFGRDQGVKYPSAFTIPSDREVKNILALASELSINLLDTAPAYGNSESRLGQLLNNRQDWIITTKVGEEFDGQHSSFDFSHKHTQESIERSLRRLNSDYLDIVLIHSNGNDLKILKESDCLETLRTYQQKGLIRAIGMSTKTIEGGILAAELMDIVMLTYNLQQQDQQVLDFARENNCGVFVKKGLMSGHFQSDSKHSVQDSLQLILNQKGIQSTIVGTINPKHLKQNVLIAKQILNKGALSTSVE